jgi:hypothetical protein
MSGSCTSDLLSFRITNDELQRHVVIWEKYVQLTGPPYQLRYHTTFLVRFNNTVGQEQQRSQSPAMSPTGREGQDMNNESTIVPPSTIQTTTPPQTKPNMKKPCTNDGTNDQQTTLTQIWTPRPTQVLDFDLEMNKATNKGETESAVCGILGSGEQTRIESCIIRIPESMVESQ